MRKLAAIAGLAIAVLASGCATGFVSKPTDVTDTSATVNGIVWTTDGGPVSYWVEYGTTSAYGQESAHRDASVAKNTPRDVSIPISGLSPAGTWHYRLCAEDAQAGICSRDATLSTGDSAVGEATQCEGGQTPPCNFQGPFPLRDTVTLDAHSTAVGGSPSGTVEMRFGAGSRGASTYQGDVTCLHVDGNVAIIGALGQHFGPFADDHYPVAFVIRVTDGGGPGSGDDKWEFLASEAGDFDDPPPPAPTDCPSFVDDPPDPFPNPGVNQEGDLNVTDGQALSTQDR